MVDKAKLLFTALIVILLVLCVLPIILKAVDNVNGISGISSYTGVPAATGLIPIIFIAAVIGGVILAVFFKPKNG